MLRLRQAQECVDAELERVEGDVRLGEARTALEARQALAVELELVEREGAVWLRQARERVDAELESAEREAQAKQSDARAKTASGEQARRRSTPGALVPIVSGAPALAPSHRSRSSHPL